MAVLAPVMAASVIGAGVAAAQPASAAVSADRFLSAVIPCESGGDPHAVNPSGAGGLFQFMPSTWRAVGGSGLPQNASVAEQWKRAKILYAQQGSSPWVSSQHCWSKKL
ncbi:MAG: transglycosylase family protein [Frankia sp.]|nr:transglycosylase family protein [Frankia sp.]